MTIHEPTQMEVAAGAMAFVVLVCGGLIALGGLLVGHLRGMQDEAEADRKVEDDGEQ